MIVFEKPTLATTTFGYSTAIGVHLLKHTKRSLDRFGINLAWSQTGRPAKSTTSISEKLSEKLSDVVDVAIKYGGGNQDVVSLLLNMSDVTMNIEIAIKTRDGSRFTTELQRWSELEKKLQDVMRRLEG